jgi:hypothetical protein
MADYAPRIVIDFDGVLHSYTTPWTTPGKINDAPTPGAQSFLGRLLDSGWEVVIQSTRAATPEGANAIAEWLVAHDFPLPPREPTADPRAAYVITAEKLPALVYLDDRALRFDGTFPTLAVISAASRPWNR